MKEKNTLSEVLFKRATPPIKSTFEPPLCERSKVTEYVGTIRLNTIGVTFLSVK